MDHFVEEIFDGGFRRVSLMQNEPLHYPGGPEHGPQHPQHDPHHEIEPDPECATCQWIQKHPRPAWLEQREAMTKEAIGWKDLAVPAAGLALMAPMANPPSAQAAPAGAQGQAIVQQKQQMTQEQMVQIATFYAGKPVTVTVKDLGGIDGTTGPAGSSTVFIAPKIKKLLDEWMPYINDPGRGPVIGTYPLGVLIHEALHTRGPNGPANQRQDNGFYYWDDEWQAHQLSYNLVPDALQRFFHIPMESKLGQAYYKVAQSLGYNGNLGGPQTPGQIEGYGDRTISIFGPDGGDTWAKQQWVAEHPGERPPWYDPNAPNQEGDPNWYNQPGTWTPWPTP